MKVILFVVALLLVILSTIYLKELEVRQVVDGDVLKHAKKTKPHHSTMNTITLNIRFVSADTSYFPADNRKTNSWISKPFVNTPIRLNIRWDDSRKGTRLAKKLQRIIVNESRNFDDSELKREIDAITKKILQITPDSPSIMDRFLEWFQQFSIRSSLEIKVLGLILTKDPKSGNPGHDTTGMVFSWYAAPPKPTSYPLFLINRDNYVLSKYCVSSEKRFARVISHELGHILKIPSDSEFAAVLAGKKDLMVQDNNIPKKKKKGVCVTNKIDDKYYELGSESRNKIDQFAQNPNG